MNDGLTTPVLSANAYPIGCDETALDCRSMLISMAAKATLHLAVDAQFIYSIDRSLQASSYSDIPNLTLTAKVLR